MTAVLREVGIDVAHHGSSWEDAEALAVTCPDIIVVDLWMPSFDAEALALIRRHAPAATLVVVTALEIHEAVAQVAHCGVDLVLSKLRAPTEIARLIADHASQEAAA